MGMAETGAVIAAWPHPNDTLKSMLRISGTSTSVGRASWQLEQLHKEHIEREAMATKPVTEHVTQAIMEQIEIPAMHMSAVTNASFLADVRDKCGGIMIALQPSLESGGPLLACI